MTAYRAAQNYPTLLGGMMWGQTKALSMPLRYEVTTVFRNPEWMYHISLTILEKILRDYGYWDQRYWLA